MGFEVSGDGQKLDFTGTKYEGLEVTIDAAPLGLLLDVAEKYAQLTGGDMDMAVAAPIFGVIVGQFAEVLEEWNVTRKGEPVPADLGGLRSLDAKFVMAVIGAWVTGTAEAGDDLGKDSSSGGSSQGAMTAAAALSSSLPNSEPQRLLSGSATAGTACRRRSWPSPRGCCGCSTSTRRSTRGTRREAR